MNNLNLESTKMMDIAVPSNKSMGMTHEFQKKLNGISYNDLINISGHKNSILIDLRESEDIKKKSSLKNSLNIPYSLLHSYLEKNKEKIFSNNIIFYCAVGERSALAVQLCQSYNLSNVNHLVGGIKNWLEEEKVV